MLSHAWDIGIGVYFLGCAVSFFYALIMPEQRVKRGWVPPEAAYYQEMGTVIFLWIHLFSWVMVAFQAADDISSAVSFRHRPRRG